jgi:hypothetical protein
MIRKPPRGSGYLRLGKASRRPPKLQPRGDARPRLSALSDKPTGKA